MNVLKPKEHSSIAEFGVGSVGIAAICAAKILKCKTIITVDRIESRLSLAKSLGATNCIDTSDSDFSGSKKLYEEVIKIIPGGVDYALDTTANSTIIGLVQCCLANLGSLALVGIPSHSAEVGMDMNNLIAKQLTIRGVVMGYGIPKDSVTNMIKYYQICEFPVNEMITTYKFSDINQAFKDVMSGKTFKAVLVMPE